MKRQNKIESSLSADQLKSFLDELRTMPAPTLAKIQELVQQKFGVRVSLMGAKTFKDKTFDAYLARLETTSQLAQAVATARTENPGATLADAASDIMGQQLFEWMNETTAIKAQIAELTPLQAARILQSLRAEDRKVEALRLEIEKFKVEQARKERELTAVLVEAERKKGQKKGGAEEGLSLETINRIRGIYGLAPAKSNGDET